MHSSKGMGMMIAARNRTTYHRDPQNKAIARKAFLKNSRYRLSEARRVYSITSMISKGMWAHPSKDPYRDTVWLGNFELSYQDAVNLGAKIFEGDAKREWLTRVKSKSLGEVFRDLIAEDEGPVPIDPFSAFKNL